MYKQAPADRLIWRASQSKRIDARKSFDIKRAHILKFPSRML